MIIKIYCIILARTVIILLYVAILHIKTEARLLIYNRITMNQKKEITLSKLKHKQQSEDIIKLENIPQGAYVLKSLCKKQVNQGINLIQCQSMVQAKQAIQGLKKRNGQLSKINNIDILLIQQQIKVQEKIPQKTFCCNCKFGNPTIILNYLGGFTFGLCCIAYATIDKKQVYYTNTEKIFGQTNQTYNFTEKKQASKYIEINLLTMIFIIILSLACLIILTIFAICFLKYCGFFKQQKKKSNKRKKKRNK